MSVIGSSCLVFSSGLLHHGIIRAASQPAFQSSDYSQIKVLVEWVDRDSVREWLDFSKEEKVQAVFLEQSLLWAKRVLVSEQSRAVAWPAKAFFLLCGTIPKTADTVVVEYFCDKERSYLYLHETKELMLSEAKLTLAQHPQLLCELSEWEERMRQRELLSTATSQLTGQRVSVCNVQRTGPWISGVVTAHNLQTTVLTVLEDVTQITHTVNPLMVHVVLDEDGQRPTSRRSSLQATSLAQALLSPSNGQPPSSSQSPQHQRVWSSDPSSTHPHPLSRTDSLHSLGSTGSPHHLASPVLQDSQSTGLYPLVSSGSTTSLSSVGGNFNKTLRFETFHNDSSRRSSLQHVSQSLLRSEPNLFRRSSLDPMEIQRINMLYDSQPDLTQIPELGAVAPLHAPSPPHSHVPHTQNSNGFSLPHSSPRNSCSQLSQLGSGPALNSPGDPALPGFPSEELFRQERSKSLENINIFGRLPPTQSPQKRRSSFGYPHNGTGLGRKNNKRARFDVLPSIPQELGGMGPPPPPGSLSRSASIPTLFPPKFKDKLINSRFAHDTLSASRMHQDDELDMIHEIINKDQSLDTPTRRPDRTQSLVNIPAEFSTNISAASLSSLTHGLPVLHSNYGSEPNFAQICSPPSYESSCKASAATTSTLAHDGQSSTVNTFATSEQLGDQYVSRSRRNSGFDQSYPLSAQTTPTIETQAAGFDFRRKGSAQSLASSYSDVECGTPGSAFEFGGNPASGGGSGLSSTTTLGGSFQFPNPNLVTSTSPPLPTSLSQSMLPPQSSNTGSLRGQPLSRLLSTASVRGLNTRQSKQQPLRQQGVVADLLLSPTPILKVENASLTVGEMGGGREGSSICEGFPENPCSSQESHVSARVVPEAEVFPSLLVKGEKLETIEELAEFSIARIVNKHVGHVGRGEMDEEEGMSEEEGLLDEEDEVVSPLGVIVSPSSSATSSGVKNARVKASPQDQREKPKRGRGRPRLTEEEKQRRKELRELGLMKRSRRRTKEEVAQWRAQKILSPAKRGRKPGSGKKHIIKAATGKVVFVSVDLSKYPNGTVLLQNGFCRAFPGVSKCLECSSCEGDLPSTRYCRFLEFRKLHIQDNSTPIVSVEGFANYMDVSAEDLVPWTPLKTGYSGLDESAALHVLSQVAPHFLSVINAEAKSLPEGNVTPVWKRAVRGIRELCDTCDTSLFNFHWVCNHCGFCICPACYQEACDHLQEEEGVGAVSSMQTHWPACVSDNLPHRPSGLIVAHIIPANVLSNVVRETLRICEAHRIPTSVPRPLQRLIYTLSRLQPRTKFKNDLKRSKGAKNKQRQLPLHMADTSPGVSPQPNLFTSSPFPSTSPSLSPSPSPSLPVLEEISTLELPHSCSSPHEDLYDSLPVAAPHTWLCDDTLLCLLDPSSEENLRGFKARWRRGEVVVVSGVNHQLSKDLWTPASFERDFGDELADLVDCKIHVGLVMREVPCRKFWAGFENMEARLKDPTTDEPRLLKLKDWPTGDDFSEKLPRRFADLMNALPFPEYTKRDGKMNMATSLPGFFVKPDLGPKMYNAYGSPAYSQCGTTNLHLDISDAVNVMVHCGIPHSVEKEERRMIEAEVAKECCPQTLRRIRKSGAQVGAMWHMYAASDADKIRALLSKVFEERGMRQPAGTDPIHDQLIYLDFDLRQRLYNEYGVKGWAVAQCVGDAIFIPAGAPHQVRNLCSCIKVAEDFVSPEHVSECLSLTEEFRQLSDRHANHEDKLQMKNIIYHCMKDIVGILKPPSTN